MPTLDIDWINNSQVNLSAVERACAQIQHRTRVEGANLAAWQLRAVSCIDLTTLSGDDTSSNVFRLCSKAIRPLAPQILKALDFPSITTAAVCVYPARVADCVKSFESLGMKVPIAAVATGFPSGQYGLESRLDEIRYAVEAGASEIDIVINRPAALAGDWETVFNEIVEMKKACGDAHLKAILATGELATLRNVRKASLTAMCAGADFIKTSTGKETVNATLPVGLTMMRAISDFHSEKGKKIGFKPAGGIRTSKDAIEWLILLREVLGREWLDSSLFRFGASGLLDDLEERLFTFVTGRFSSCKNMSF